MMFLPRIPFLVTGSCAERSLRRPPAASPRAPRSPTAGGWAGDPGRLRAVGDLQRATMDVLSTSRSVAGLTAPGPISTSPGCNAASARPTSTDVRARHSGRPGAAPGQPGRGPPLLGPDRRPAGGYLDAAVVLPSTRCPRHGLPGPNCEPGSRLHAALSKPIRPMVLQNGAYPWLEDAARPVGRRPERARAGGAGSGVATPLTAEQQRLAAQFLPLARSWPSRSRRCSPNGRTSSSRPPCLALVEAAQSFDPSRNVRFATFARFRIWGALMDVAA